MAILNGCARRPAGPARFRADGIGGQAFGEVPDAASRAEYQGGWYCDQNGGGKASVSVCDETCNIITGSAGGRVDIILGCDTGDSPPR